MTKQAAEQAMGTLLWEQQHDATASVAKNLQSDSDHHLFGTTEMLRDLADFGDCDIRNGQIYALSDHLRKSRGRMAHADIADFFQGVQLDTVQFAKGHSYLPDQSLVKS
jgi:hypothetical protein